MAASMGKRQAAEIDRTALAAMARRVLAGNRLRGVSAWESRRYDFVCPSPSSYPFQWFWDSAFHAVALLHVDPELSKQEIRCLLQAAQPEGFIPHMILWERDAHSKVMEEYSIRLAHPFFTATIQPPVLARAIARIFEATGDKRFLAEVLPPVLGFFRWLAATRDPDCDGLIAIISPDESGLDASPKYDAWMGIVSKPPSETLPSLRRGMQRLFEGAAFVWEDVMVNSIYADGLAALSGLCRALDPMHREAAGLEKLSRQVLRSLQQKCWDERAGVFWDLAGSDEQPAKTLTFSCLFPLILPELEERPAKRLIEEHLLNENEFWLPYPVPSVAASEPTFDPDWHTSVVWRGPSWVNVNWYLYWGLRNRGRADIASELARRTFAMVSLGGIREFFNPRTAEGYGAEHFGWTCLVLDLLAAEGKSPHSAVGGNP